MSYRYCIQSIQKALSMLGPGSTLRITVDEVDLRDGPGDGSEPSFWREGLDVVSEYMEDGVDKFLEGLNDRLR